MTARFAPAAVGLALFVALAQIRMDEPWSQGVLLLVAAAPAVAVLGLGLTAPREGGRPATATTIVLVAGLVLSGIAIARLGEVAASLEDSGTRAWAIVLFLAVAAACARRSRSAACTLIAALAGIAALLQGWEWVFDADSDDTFRALLLASFVALFVAGLNVAGRNGTVLVSAAGLAAVVAGGGALFFFPFLFVFGEGEGAGWGWELVTLVQAGLLIAYAAREGAPGPGYLGFFALLAFLVTVAIGPESFFGGDDESRDATLSGWPLAIGIATLLAVAVGARPRAGRAV